MTQSLWDELSIGTKTIDILKNLTYGGRDRHHLGRSFATGYQLAILLLRHHEDVRSRFPVPVGGRGIGSRSSFAQYLSGELSRRVKSGEFKGIIEGGFLSNAHLRQLVFDYDGEPVSSSLTGTDEDVSILRYIVNE